jgi:photosystem II stability/assembly factor-like uncharacterized protein
VTEPPDTEGTDVEQAPAVPVFDLAPGQYQFDAALDEKADWEGAVASLPGDEPLGGTELDDPGTPVRQKEPEARPRLINFVMPPPAAAASAPGARAPRRAADVGGVDAGARHNWVPTGPRNVGGRVTALAVHPTDPRTMFAGAASGGVHRTTDGGETWTPLWHDLPSLAVGAIAICRDQPNVVYVGTGENHTGGGEAIPGNGVYRSRDGGDSWENLSTAALPVPGTAPNLAFSFEAIAVHPTTPDHCWAVGQAGVFRTTNGGKDWTQFEAGVHYSDIVFSLSAGGTPTPILYLVLATSRTGAFVIRLDDPAGATQADISAAAHRSRVAEAPKSPAFRHGVLTPAPDHPSRGKLAICASRPDIAYVSFAAEGGGHFGLFRTRNVREGDFTKTGWRRLEPHLDWGDEGQGEYNLSLAVDPNEPNNVVTGMVELYLSRNANAARPGDVRWLRAMAWELNVVDRAHHADNHAAVFAPVPGAAAGATPALWVANDGGISRSVDWPTGSGYEGQLARPLGPGDDFPTVNHPFQFPIVGVDGDGNRVAQAPLSWRKRSHGISAGQMYDLTQSPLLPTLYGCGFQDNGVWASSGGESWSFVLGADGGFVAFDPDDAYRFLATWQSGIAEVDFPGRLLGTFPAPGDPILDDLWPREIRTGFVDRAAFVADTAHHPRKSGRILHARLNRLYGSPARGERWSPESVGAGLELRYSGGGNNPRLELLPSDGARHLGLVPQVNGLGTRSYKTEPFALTDGDALHLLADGNAVDVVFHAGGAIANLAAASAAEVAAYIRANVPAPPPGRATATALPFFPPTGVTVEITTRGVGAGQLIAIGGSALTPPAAPPNSLPRLGLLAGNYAGGPDRPASVTLGFPGFTREAFVANRNLTGLELTIQVNGGPVRHVQFAPPAFPDPAWVRTGELVAAVAAALSADPVDVVSRAVFKGIRLTALTNRGLQTSGTAASRLNLIAGNPQQAGTHWVTLDAALQPFRDRVLGQNVGNFNSFDLTSGGAPLRLVIDDNGGRTATVVFNAAAGAVNLRCVTAEELQRIVAAALAAGPAASRPRVVCDLLVAPDEGKPTAIRYAESEPDTVWIAGENGFLAVSHDDGGHWRAAADPRFALRDRAVEAITIDPRDSKVVLVGLAGRTTTRSDDPGFLFRTKDDGAHWDHVGGDVKDTTGALVGVNALEIDPAAPDTAFAATDVGVFRSTDGGTHWQPFNEGLPNVLVRDLAFVRSTRTLRAAAWGRGTYERQLGDRPPKDVRLFVRANGIDDGRVRPAPEGPDVFATTPQPAGPASPDIKVNRERPAAIGPDELVDGVEFDDDLEHEEPVAGAASHVFVQVHNGGSFPASNVRIVALWADASGGPPPLPADFWTKFAAGPLDASLGSWKLIGDLPPAGAPPPPPLVVSPGYPRVHTFDVTWPNEIGAMRKIGLLLLVSSPDDALGAGALDVPALLAAEPKIAYRETAVSRVTEDHAFLLKQTGPVAFTVANPAAGTSAAGGLGIAAAALGAAQTELAGGAEPFNLSPAPQAIQLSTPPQAITIAFVQGPRDIRRLDRAGRVELASVMSREFLLAGIPARADTIPVVLPAPDFFDFAIHLRGTGGATIVIGAPGGGVTDAAPILGFFPGAPATELTGDTGDANGEFNLAGGASIQVTATNTATISLQASDFADPANATGREVRKALNRGLAAAQLPVRAIVPKVDLWIRRSATDLDGVPVSASSHRLADLVARPSAVAGADARASLFDLVARLSDGRVKAGTDNFLYLRTTNLGTAPQADARHRLFQLAVGAAPITATAIGAAVNDRVPAGGSAIVEFAWNPGAVAPGDRVFVLAIVDHDSDGRRLEPPSPGFDDVDRLEAFCVANANAAYREFTAEA